MTPRRASVGENACNIPPLRRCARLREAQTSQRTFHTPPPGSASEETCVKRAPCPPPQHHADAGSRLPVWLHVWSGSLRARAPAGDPAGHPAPRRRSLPCPGCYQAQRQLSVSLSAETCFSRVTTGVKRDIVSPQYSVGVFTRAQMEARNLRPAFFGAARCGRQGRGEGSPEYFGDQGDFPG